MKKLLAILTAALMLLVCLPAMAEEELPPWALFSDDEFIEWLMAEEDLEKDAYLAATLADAESEEYAAFMERLEAIEDEMMRESASLYVQAVIDAQGGEEPEPEPTEEPTPEPTEEPTPEPTEEPTPEPTEEPTPEPTEEPTPEPTEEPTPEPTEEPTPEPTEEPTPEPTEEPTPEPTEEPTPKPTKKPTPEPTEEPTEAPTKAPTEKPTKEPTAAPTKAPTPEPQPDLTIMAPAELPAGQTVALSVIVKDGVKFGTPVWTIVKKSGVSGAYITENGILTTVANSTGTITVRVTSSKNSKLYTDMTITVRKASAFSPVN